MHLATSHLRCGGSPNRTPPQYGPQNKACLRAGFVRSAVTVAIHAAVCEAPNGTAVASCLQRKALSSNRK